MSGSALEIEISDLEQLDFCRRETRTWCEEGRTALRLFLNRERPEIEWAQEVDIGEQAFVIKALCHERIRPGQLNRPVEELQNAPVVRVLDGSASFLYSGSNDRRTFMDASMGLAALSSAPKGAFAPMTAYLYYIVIREMYYASPPEWSVGGMRAGCGGAPTAHVTSHAVRGILAFARTLQRTAEYCRSIAKIENPHTTSSEVAPDWLEQDSKRRSISLQTTLAQRAWNLAFSMDRPIPPDFREKTIKEFMVEIKRHFVQSLDDAVRAFETAERLVADFRVAEVSAASTSAQHSLVARSSAAHAIAFAALQDATQRARTARKLLPNGVTESIDDDPTFHDRLQKLANHFNDAECKIRKLVQPARHYLSGVLDRELAKAAGTGNTVAFEPAEMAAAASGFGVIADEWDDERILSAAAHLGRAISDTGFPIGRPYHVGASSYYMPSQSAILTCYAKIMENTTAELTPAGARRLIGYFRKTRFDLGRGAASWRWEHERERSNSAARTASAVIALDHITRMLDRRINDSVLKYFNWRRPKKFKLHDLFYADYGLAAAAKDLPGELLPKESVALYLERMRAHVAGVPLEGGCDALYSMVLHGPPGTGKTTLIEALAASADVPLVEVTPSDIVVRGSDAIEERANAVLRALSLLTKTVILFDEFDPVLRSRSQSNSAASPTLAFLTAGMLPKLKRLFDSAKDNNIAYALVTNYISEIDSAAIRGGRFDQMVGVYAPDLLSRYCRLRTQMDAYQVAYPHKIERAVMALRLARVVMSTKGSPMHSIGKPGWFTAPLNGVVPPGSAFDYLFSDTDRPFQAPEEEEWRDAEPLDRETKLMNLIKAWDGLVGDAPRWLDWLRERLGQSSQAPPPSPRPDPSPGPAMKIAHSNALPTERRKGARRGEDRAARTVVPATHHSVRKPS